MSFLEELAKEGVISEGQIAEIKNLANEKHGGDIDEALAEVGISEDNVLKVKGEYLKIPTKKVNVNEISFDVLKYIPEDSATHYHFAPFALNEGVLEVGVIDPENIQAMDALQFISAKLGIPFKIFLISKGNYKEILEVYKGLSSQVEQALEEIDKEETIDIKATVNPENISKEINKVKPEEKIVEDAPVIKIVAVILRNAIEGNASDIHIEHTGD